MVTGMGHIEGWRAVWGHLDPLTVSLTGFTPPCRWQLQVLTITQVIIWDPAHFILCSSPQLNQPALDCRLVYWIKSTDLDCGLRPTKLDKELVV